MLPQLVHVTICLPVESFKVMNRKFALTFCGVKNKIRTRDCVVFSSSNAHYKLCLSLPPNLNALYLKQLHQISIFKIKVSYHILLSYVQSLFL